MKTKLFITIMVLCFVVKSWGQKQEEIEINPFGIDRSITKTEKGNSVKFKISNVNTFKINGIIESKSLNIDFEIPEIIQNLNKTPIIEKTDGDPNAIVKSYELQIQETIDAINFANKSSNKESVNQLLKTLKNLFPFYFQIFWSIDPLAYPTPWY